jgi:replicative DNA helicase
MEKGIQNVVKQIPYNLEAELGILNCILIDPQTINECKDLIQVEDFYELRNQIIYKALLDINSNGLNPDVQILVSELNKINKFQSIGGAEYINSILNYNYSTTNLDTYLNLVKDASIRRKTINVLSELSQKGYDTSSSISNYLDVVEQEVFALSQNRRTTDFRTFGSVAEIVRNNSSEASSTDKEITGLNTGFDNLNKATLGLQKGALIILAARPAMGKSAFSLNLALQVAQKNNATVAFFSLEMPAEQLVQRLYASQTNIELSNIIKGKLTDEEWARLENSRNTFEATKIFFDDSSSNTVGDIKSKCRKLKEQNGLDLIVVDYLQLIQMSGKYSTINEGIGLISKGLKQLARELEVPVIALAQLSRGVEQREDKRPLQSDLRDSGSIEQDADIIAFLYREEYYTHQRPGECDLIIRKNRQGQSCTLKYLFDGKLQKFTDNGKMEENE